jgi:hypothetical protein
VSSFNHDVRARIGWDVNGSGSLSQGPRCESACDGRLSRWNCGPLVFVDSAAVKLLELSAAIGCLYSIATTKEIRSRGRLGPIANSESAPR